MFGGPRKKEEESGAIPPSVKAKAELAKTLVGTSIHDRIDYAETRKQRFACFLEMFRVLKNC